MNTMNERAIEAYRLNELELSINSAQPVGLIVLLYDAAIESTKRAMKLIEAGDIPAKAREISRASNIVSELRGVLDLNQGDLAVSLAALYDYMSGQLLKGNLRNSTSELEEVARLLTTLRSAWAELAERERDKARPAKGAPAAVAARAG